MKKLANRIALALLCLWLLPQSVNAQTLLVPVGQVVGLELGNHTVTVAAFDQALGAEAQAAGLEVGDQIVNIDGREIGNAEDVRHALEQSDGSIEVQVQRDGTLHRLRLTPQITQEGPRLGVYLRQGVTGIGTVTFYNPDTGSFGTLGHGVNDAGGKLLELEQGSIYPARVLSVRKGLAGEPGQLMGALEPPISIGTLSQNTSQGVFGTALTGWTGEPIPVGSADLVHTGPAAIRSTVAGTKAQEYSVEILKVYPKSRQNGRNLLLKVTDPALLEATGGIVQGMSGSPIIQDGRLIGAVTHVLVNDPTTGYGIFIENMLDAEG